MNLLEFSILEKKTHHGQTDGWTDGETLFATKTSSDRVDRDSGGESGHLLKMFLLAL